jgi:hypothetical protein
MERDERPSFTKANDVSMIIDESRVDVTTGELKRVGFRSYDGSRYAGENGT